MWLKGQATQSTIVDRLTKLIAGEISDDVGSTVPLGDRWIRQVAGQDFLHAPAASKVALPVMAMRAGYFQPLGNRAANGLGVNGNVYRLSSIQTAAPGGATRWFMYVTARTANTVPGNYSTAVVDVLIVNADTGAALAGPSTFSPNAAGVITLTAGFGNGQITVSNDETGILSVGNASGFFNPTSCHVRAFSTAYMGGIDYWPMAYRRYTGESSTFTVAPPGVAGTDYVADVGINTSPTTAVQPTSRPSNAHIAGGFLWGLGIKTNTGLGGGALYSVSWNCYGMGLHLSLNGSQYVQAELNGGRALLPDAVTYKRVMGLRATQWLRMFTGTPLASTPIQYWLCVKADRVIVVLNGDPGTGGVLTCAGVWTFTPSDATNDKFPWAFTGNVINYQADNGANSEGAYSATRAFNLLAQEACANGYGLPASRDWATGFMRCDCVLSTHNGGSFTSTAGAGWYTDDQGGVEGIDTSGPAMGSYYSTLTGGLNPGLTVIGGSGDVSGSQDWDKAHAYPTTEAKPWPGDGKWWLYGWSYMDSETPNGETRELNHYRGSLADKFLYVPTTGWSSGDEITDTISGKTYFLVAPDYGGAGMGRTRIATNSYRGGIAIEEAA